MRSALRAIPAGRTVRILALLTEVEAAAADLSQAEVLEAIGRTGRLEAVLRARFVVVAAEPSAPPATPDTPRYLDTRQAAAYLGVSAPTVARLTKAGTLPCCRPSSGTVRYDRADLDAYMAAHRSGEGR